MFTPCDCGSEPGDCNGVWCTLCKGHHSDHACVAIPARKLWVLHDEDGTSCYKIAIFRKREVIAAYGEITPENAESIMGALLSHCGSTYSWGTSYSGPGYGFSHGPYLMVEGSSVVIKQFSGLDI